jgi:hypothetical protein
VPRGTDRFGNSGATVTTTFARAWPSAKWLIAATASLIYLHLFRQM